MDWLAFISNLIDSLAWPATIVFLALFFRSRLNDLFEKLNNVKFKDVEVSFDRRLDRAKESMAALPESQSQGELPAELLPPPLPKTEKELIARIADLSPSAAVMESWRLVEQALDFYCKQHGLKQPVSNQTLMNFLKEDPYFSDGLLSAFQELRMLRNNAAHSKASISKESALEFAELSEKLASELSISALI